MLFGNADIDQLLEGAARIEAFAPDPIDLADVTCFQMSAEMRNESREALLPPALHPTVPPSVILQVWDVGTSPYGAFAMGIVRVSCRSGVRARGFTLRVICNNADATAALRSTLGFPAIDGEVGFRSSYDGVKATLAVDGKVVLDLSALDPDPLSVNDVQYTGTMNLAHTPRGPRLVQVEANHEPVRVERLVPKLHHFDGEGLGHPLLLPYREIISTVATESVSFPPVRFLCSTTETAFTGTEPV